MFDKKKEAYRHHEANVHADESDTKEGSHANAEIELVNLEEAICFLILDQPEHGSHYNGGECHKRCIAKKRG